MIADCEQSQLILELIGFQKARIPSESGGPDEDFLILNEDRLDTREFELALKAIAHF